MNSSLNGDLPNQETTNYVTYIANDNKQATCTECGDKDCNPYWYLKVAGFVFLVAIGLPFITGNK